MSMSWRRTSSGGGSAGGLRSSIMGGFPPSNPRSPENACAKLSKPLAITPAWLQESAKEPRIRGSRTAQMRKWTGLTRLSSPLTRPLDGTTPHPQAPAVPLCACCCIGLFPASAFRGMREPYKPLDGPEFAPYSEDLVLSMRRGHRRFSAAMPCNCSLMSIGHR